MTDDDWKTEEDFFVKTSSPTLTTDDDKKVSLEKHPLKEDDKISVFEEGIHALAYATLVYLFVDFRYLAGIGAAQTSPEDIALASDHGNSSFPSSRNLVDVMLLFMKELRMAGMESVLEETVRGTTSKSIHRSALMMAMEERSKQRNKNDSRGNALVDIQCMEIYLKNLLGLQSKIERRSSLSFVYKKKEDSHKLHNHAGSEKYCLCKNYGLHHMQALLDKLAREKLQMDGMEHGLDEKENSHLIQSSEDDAIDDMLEDEMSRSFVANIFKKKKMTSIEVTHCYDKYPFDEPVYAIVTDKETKQVICSFQGTANLANAIANFRAFPQQTMNIRKSNIPVHGIHRAYFDYLFTPRRDSGKSRAMIIAEQIYETGNDLFGDDFQVMIVGHSLGGSLCQLFGLYLCGDDYFTAVSPIRLFTFNAPNCGGRHYAQVFSQMEEERRIVHARFTNKKDFIPRLPPNMIPNKDGAQWESTGVHIELRGEGKVPAVNYLGPSETFLSSVQRAYSNNFMLVNPLLINVGQNHACDTLLHLLQMRGISKDCDGIGSLDDIYNSIFGEREFEEFLEC